MPLTVVTEAARQPVDLCDLKLHLKLVVENCADYTVEDNLLSSLIAAACASFETKRKTQLIEAEYRWDFTEFSDKLELPRPPLMSVSKVAYIDTAGDEQTIADSNYEVQANRTPGYVRFYPDYEFPEDVDTDIEYPVQVTYKCGYGKSHQDVPSNIRLFMKNIIGTYYMQRESMVISHSALSVEDLREQMTHLIAGTPKPLRLG